jgi:hypothetical protein
MNKKFILNFDELENYNFPFDELFKLQVNHNDVKYDFLVRLASKNSNLICWGSGAYDPKKIIYLFLIGILGKKIFKNP